MIYYFSGNGNSRHVAQRLATALGDCTTRIDHTTLSAAESCITTDRHVIWVCPVYSWGLPLPVKEFISRVNANGATHFLVLTCGDDTGMAHRDWRRLCDRRGWDAAATFSVQMPNTYTLLPGFDVDKPEIAAKKIDAATGRIDFIARRIKDGWRGDDVTKGRFPRFKTSVIYPRFMKYGVHPERFCCDTKRCISCGRCEAACPMGNVRLIDSRPRWESDCALCLACYHICPVHAVNYGKATISKGQYLFKDTTD